MFLEKLTLASTMGVAKPILTLSVVNARGQLVEASQVGCLRASCFRSTRRAVLYSVLSDSLRGLVGDDHPSQLFFLAR